MGTLTGSNSPGQEVHFHSHNPESEPEEMTSAPSTVDIQAIEDVETTSLMHEEPVVANGTKKIVRHYEGINPEVEAELKKVIEELEAKGGENLIVNH